MANALDLTVPNKVVITDVNGKPVTSTQLPPATTLGAFDIATTVTSTFTPIVSFGGSSANVVYITQEGYYTLTGNVFTFSLNIALSAKGPDTGVITIGGLPYNYRATGSAYSLAHVLLDSVVGLTGTVVATIVGGFNSFLLNQQLATSYAALDDNSFTDTTAILLSGSYLV